MLRTKRESDLTERTSVEFTSFILGASSNILHTERTLERPLVLAIVVFDSINNRTPWECHCVKRECHHIISTLKLFSQSREKMVHLGTYILITANL